MLHPCCYRHFHTASNLAFSLQLPLICCFYNYNWEASEILNHLCLLHLSPESWLLLASDFSTEESALLLIVLLSLLLYCQFNTTLLNILLQLVSATVTREFDYNYWHWSILLLNTMAPCSKVMIHEEDALRILPKLLQFWTTTPCHPNSPLDVWLQT